MKRKVFHNDEACSFYREYYEKHRQEEYLRKQELKTLDSLKECISKLTEERDHLLHTLNTLGHVMVAKKDVYNFVMGDLTSLNKYKGDPEY